MLLRIGVGGILLAGACLGGWWTMIRMPGESYRGPLPALTGAEAELRDTLRRDVETLAREIGERNLHRYENLKAAAKFIETSLAEAGLEVEPQKYEVGGRTCVNVGAEIPGRADHPQIVVVGAHYDTVYDCPGANDNASGVAATLALARLFAGRQPARTLRFVFFVNEEPPHFQTKDMGSWVHAKRCRQRGEEVVAMLSLETIGYYRDAKGSQGYPPPLNFFYPSTGNFIAFVGNHSSRTLVRQVVGSFRRHATLPSEGGAVPGFLPGIGWSDHWAFWQEGYPAIMVTDTAPFRYPHYHLPSDTPDKLDYERMARLVNGLMRVVEDLARCD
ncbi:MAG: M28 family peptidase [Planctomycetota bacterium]